MHRNLPNTLSVVRIVASISLLFFFKEPKVLIPIYLFCGISDFLDGYLARRYNLVSQWGARLDSIADTVFYLILLFYLYQVYGYLFIPYLYTIFIVIIIKFFSLLAGIIKYRKFIGLHTYANKLAGLLVFLLPFCIWTGLFPIIPLILIIAFIASVEELLLILKAPRESINLNRKSIFMKD